MWPRQNKCSNLRLNKDLWRSRFSKRSRNLWHNNNSLNTYSHSKDPRPKLCPKSRSLRFRITDRWAVTNQFCTKLRNLTISLLSTMLSLRLRNRLSKLLRSKWLNSLSKILHPSLKSPQVVKFTLRPPKTSCTLCSAQTRSTRRHQARQSLKKLPRWYSIPQLAQSMSKRPVKLSLTKIPLRHKPQSN